MNRSVLICGLLAERLAGESDPNVWITWGSLAILVRGRTIWP
jgi:hypothetical protein